MFSLRPFLLLCVLFPLQLVRADNNWYAVFYNATLKQQLNQTFLSYVQLTPNDNSANQFQCDHTTIAFQPADNSSYIPRLGETQSETILAYAHDEHGQAILVRYNGDNYIPTLNSFPHVTISSEGKAPYSAVYSNDLWARVNASGLVNITLRAGFPDTVSFVDTTNVVNNSLTFPLNNITIGKNTYNATTVQVTIYPPGTIFGLEGIFCVNIGWNGSVCTPPATNSPASSSSSTSSSANSTGASSTVASSTATSTNTSTGASTGTSTGASTASGASDSSSSSASNTTTSSSSVPYNTSSSSTAAGSSSTAAGNTGMTVGVDIVSMVVVGIVGMIFA